jgi:hypothetical protein
VPKDKELKIVVEYVSKIVGVGLRWAAEQKATRALFFELIGIGLSRLDDEFENRKKDYEELRLSRMPREKDDSNKRERASEE